MIAVGTIVVVVLAAIGWFQLRDRIADQGVQAAETCVEGALTVPITVDPDLAIPITELARRYSDSAPVVRDHCVTVEVHTAESDAVSNGLAGATEQWDAASLGALPALWIPRSSDFVVGLPSGSVDGTPRSVASTPVVLAGPTAVTDALTSADIGWTDLPRLQSSSDGLDSIGLGGWGGLRLGLPLGPASDSTTAVLAAVASAVTPAPPGESLSADRIENPAVVQAISALAVTDRKSSAVSEDSTAATIERLDTDPASDLHVVPVTEQEFAGNRPGLGTFTPAGATVVADHPAVILAGPWMDETLSRAAAQFVEFVRSDAQTLVDAGFDAPVEASTDSTRSPAASVDARRALVDTVRNPVTPRRTTILLDVSGSMDTTENGRTRLQHTTAALDDQFARALDSAQLGLWVYSKDLDGSRAFRTVVPTGPLSDQVGDASRRDRLTRAADGLEPATSTSTYESVMAAFLDAQANFVPGVTNSVLLVTDGPNDDTTITAERFLSVVREMVEPTKPVAIDVVSIGVNSDAATLSALADATGGSSTTVATSDSPELAETFTRLLY